MASFVRFLALAAVLVVAAAKPVIKHVLLISPDGMHAGDLSHFVSKYPNSNFAKLVRSGITYPRAQAVVPTDSFPSLVGMLTGATPKTAGIYYESSWCRSCYPPGSNISNFAEPPGAIVSFSEAIDAKDGLTLTGAPIVESTLSLDIHGKPIYPHDYLKVTTALNVVHNAGKRTAWIDKQLGHEWVAGPGGKGCDDCFFPSQDFFPNSKTQLAQAIAYERTKITALLCQMKGLDSSCTKKVGVPAFFGATFQIINSFQKFTNTSLPAEESGGYAGDVNHPNRLTTRAFVVMDNLLGELIDGLADYGLTDSTAIIICSKYGNAPINNALLHKINPDFNQILYNITGNIAEPAYADLDDVGLIWLHDRTSGPLVGKALSTIYRDLIQADQVLWGRAVAKYFHNPLLGTDDRVPDVIVIVKKGVIYTKSKTKYEEHGGFSDDDRSIALIVSHPSIGKRKTSFKYITSQRVAPTIVGLLGLNRRGLTSPETPRFLPRLRKFFKVT